MNFRTATTAEKLNWLADLIEGPLRKEFKQSRNDFCVIGLGTRVDSEGLLITRYGDASPGFAARYGVTNDEAHALLLAEYSRLAIGRRDRDMDNVTAKDAAKILRELANRYSLGTQVA